MEFYDFSIQFGIIIPTDFHIFFRGVETTNQIIISLKQIWLSKVGNWTSGHLWISVTNLWMQAQKEFKRPFFLNEIIDMLNFQKKWIEITNDREPGVYIGPGLILKIGGIIVFNPLWLEDIATQLAYSPWMSLAWNWSVLPGNRKWTPSIKQTTGQHFLDGP